MVNSDSVNSGTCFERQYISSRDLQMHFVNCEAILYKGELPLEASNNSAKDAGQASY